MHGAATIQQLLNAGLLDELTIDLAPVLLGAGVRLFEHLQMAHLALGDPTVNRWGRSDASALPGSLGLRSACVYVSIIATSIPLSTSD